MEKHIKNLHRLGARYLPANFGPLRDANGNARVKGPCCDTMELWLGIADRRVQRATFTTDGCQSSIACGAMTAWLAEGRSLSEARRLSQADVLKAVSEGAEEHCALLAVKTLQAAIEDYERRQESAGAAPQTDITPDALKP